MMINVMIVKCYYQCNDSETAIPTILLLTERVAQAEKSIDPDSLIDPALVFDHHYSLMAQAEKSIDPETEVVGARRRELVASPVASPRDRSRSRDARPKAVDTYMYIYIYVNICIFMYI